jgi:hypothetical protein
LKFDNAISNSLKKFKSENGNSKSLDFKEMMGDKEGAEAASDENGNKSESEKNDDKNKHKERR